MNNDTHSIFSHRILRSRRLMRVTSSEQRTVNGAIRYSPSLLASLLSRRFGPRALFGRRGRAGSLDLGNLGLRITQHLAQDLIGMLAEQWRARHLAGRVGQLDRVADGQILAARRMINLDDGPGRAQRRL